MNNAPQISVLMTAYNREAYINEAIASVVASDFKEWELIVVDDGSSDRTVSIASEWEAKDPRIRVYQNPNNLGDYPNRNKAASYARGEFLKYLDSDDMIYPHGLRVMLACILAFPDAGLALSAVAEDASPFPARLTPVEAFEEHYFKRPLLGRAPGSCIIRRAVFESVGGFTGERQVGDHELWLRIASEFAVVKMPRDLYWARVHGAQEQFTDDEILKYHLHRNILLDALHASHCPLNLVSRKAAIRRLQRDTRKLCLRHLLGLRWTMSWSYAKASIVSHQSLKRMRVW
jgi:glycosyltransferase involved in cell wall biosynthesis